MSERGRDYLLFIEDILDATGKIEKYTEGMSFEAFCGNGMAVDAVVRNFGIIGEAARNIPDAVKGRHPDVEWKEAIGFRNVLIHDYFGIDLEAVWDTIKKNIPPFKEHITEALTSERSKG